jgi:hypothetical protein
MAEFQRAKAERAAIQRPVDKVALLAFAAYAFIE